MAIVIILINLCGITFPRVLLRTIAFVYVVWTIGFSGILFLESSECFTIHGQFMLLLNKLFADVELWVLFLPQFSVFEEEVVVLVFEDRVVRGNHKLLERLPHHAQELYASLVIEVLMLFFHYFLIFLLRVFIVGLITTRGVALFLIGHLIFMDLQLMLEPHLLFYVGFY